MTNYGALAILALPKMPERQLRFLLALETVTRGEDGWREIETGVLARQAGLSVTTVVKARAELAAFGRIEYRPGTGPGHPGRYRVRVDVDKPPANAGRVKPTSDAARVKPTSDAGRVNPTNPAPGSLPTGSPKPTTPNAVTSANASIALEPLALESSALSPAPAPAPARETAADLDGHAEGALSRQTDDDDDFETRPERPGPGYGLCPECGDWYAVRLAFGHLTRHYDHAHYGSTCPGSRQPPAEPVPCTGCGRTGLALTAFEGLCKACRASTRPADLDGRAGSVPAAPGQAAEDRPVRLTAGWDDRPGPGYGQCPDCGRWITVRIGRGRLAPHTGPVYGRECPGSRSRPAEPVPCTVCGNTTVVLRSLDGKCNTCHRTRRTAAS